MNQKLKEDDINASINNVEPLISKQKSARQSQTIIQQFETNLLNKQRYQWRVNCIFLLTQCIIDLSFGLDELRQSSNNQNTLSYDKIYYFIGFLATEFLLILLLFYITNFINHKLVSWKQYMTFISFLILTAQVEIIIFEPQIFLIKFLTIYLILQSLGIIQNTFQSRTYKFCLFSFLVYVIIRHQILLKLQIIVLVYTIFTCGIIVFFSLKGDINQEALTLAQQLLQNVPEIRSKQVFGFNQHAYSIIPPNQNFFSINSQSFQAKSRNPSQQQQMNQQQIQQKKESQNINNNYNTDSNTNIYNEKHSPQKYSSSLLQSATFPQTAVNQSEITTPPDKTKINLRQNQDKIYRVPLESHPTPKKSSQINKQQDQSHYSPSVQYQSQQTHQLNQIYVDILSLIPQGIALINNQREVVISNNSILNHFKCKSEEELISKIFSINKASFIQKSETPSNQTIASPVSIKKGNIYNDNNIRSNRNSSFSSAMRDSLMSKKTSLQSDKLPNQKDRRASTVSQFKLKEMQSKRLSISHNKREISELFDEILSQDLNSQTDQSRQREVPQQKRRNSMNFKIGMNKSPMCADETSKDNFQFTVEKNIIQYTFHEGDKTFSLKIICCEMQQQSSTNLSSPMPRQRKNTLGCPSPFSLNGTSGTQNQINEGIEPAILIITEDISNKILLQKLEKLNKQKKRMVASISHELRTPLNCSIGLLDLLLNHKSMPRDLLQEYLLPALYSNRLLFNIVNDIIDLSQIDSGKFQLSFKIFDLRQLLDECVMLMKISVGQKNLKLDLIVDERIPNEINSDPQRIRQIILNLLSNAVKYTYKGSIRIEAINVDASYIQLKVIDTGIGIKEESMNQIFEQFGRIQEEKVLETEGAGLGLTISMSLAKGVGGNRGIDVKSIFGKGSTFSFFILKQDQKKKGASVTKKDFFNKSLYQVISHTQGMNSVELIDLSFDNENQNNTNENSSSVTGFNAISEGSTILDHRKSLQSLKYLKEPLSAQKQPKESNSVSKGVLNLPSQNLQLNNSSMMSLSSLCSAVANENIDNGEYTINQPEIQEVSMTGSVSGYTSSIQKLSNKQQQNINFQSNNNTSLSSQSIKDVNLKIRVLDSVKDISNSACQITETSKEYYENGGSCSESKSINKFFQYSPSSMFTDEEAKKSPNKDFGRLDSIPKIFVNSADKKSSVGFKDEQFSPQYLKMDQVQLESSQTSQDNIEQSPSFDTIENPSVGSRANQMRKVDCYEEFKSMSKSQKTNSKLTNQVTEITTNKSCKCNQILIAEDNEFNLFLLKKMLETCKLEVDSTMNGQEAIDKVAKRFQSPCFICKKGYKLIFMDIDMPIKNGYEATQEIIKFCNQNNFKPPLISACSAYVGDEDKKQALKEGMTYFITKPIEMKVVQSVLKKAQIIS